MNKTIKLKIFVSYSRRDSGDFADQIQKYLSTFNYHVFTDISSINVGDVWSTVIDVNISECDIFVALITYGSLQSPHVEKEVLQAQNEKKKIIPCIQKEVSYTDVKWGLDEIQGIEFDDKYDLARKLYLKIARISQQDKPVPSSRALTSPVPDKSKEELMPKEVPQSTNKLENEQPQYFSSPIHSSSTSYLEPEKNATYSNSSN